MSDSKGIIFSQLLVVGRGMKGLLEILLQANIDSRIKAEAERLLNEYEAVESKLGQETDTPAIALLKDTELWEAPITVAKELGRLGETATAKWGTARKQKEALIKGVLLSDRLTINQISERTGLSYQNVRNILLKGPYQRVPYDSRVWMLKEPTTELKLVESA